MTEPVVIIISSFPDFPFIFLSVCGDNLTCLGTLKPDPKASKTESTDVNNGFMRWQTKLINAPVFFPIYPTQLN